MDFFNYGDHNNNNNNENREAYANGAYNNNHNENRGFHSDPLHDYEFDYEVSESVKEDRAKLSTHEFLEKHGLHQIASQLSQFISIFDSATNFFDQENVVDMLNLCLSIFRDSFVETVEEARRSMDAKAGPISFSSMRDFLSRQEMLFNEQLQRVPSGRQWSKLLPQTHIVFESLKQTYKLCIDSGMPLSWWMMHVIGPLAQNIPDHLFDENSLGEFISVPGYLQQMLHSTLEDVFTSGFGPMVKIAIQALADFALKRHDEL